MIKINLLPAEKRKAERTPVSRFALILTDVAVAAGILFYLTYVWLQIVDTGNQIEAQQAALAALQKDVEEHDRLEKEYGALQAKIREIDDLTIRDVEWWEAINALWEVIHQNPKVWIDDLRVSDDKGAQGDIKRMDPTSTLAPIYGVTIRCHVAGGEVSEMTRFRTDLKNNPVLNRTLSLVNFDVDWRLDDEREFEEKRSIGFAVVLFGFQKPTAPLPGAAVPRGGVQ